MKGKVQKGPPRVSEKVPELRRYDTGSKTEGVLRDIRHKQKKRDDVVRAREPDSGSPGPSGRKRRCKRFKKWGAVEVGTTSTDGGLSRFNWEPGPAKET